MLYPESKAGISAEVKRHRDGDSFGGEAFLLPALIQTIYIAPLHVHKFGSESLHITELIHAIACGREGRTCPYEEAHRTMR